MAAQIAARGVTNTQALDETGIVQATPVEVLEGLRVGVELGLIESCRLLKDFGRQGRGEVEFLSEACDGLRKGKIKIQLGKANKVTTLSTTVAEEEILRGIDVEGGLCFRMQETEPKELLPSRRAKAPVKPSQVVQQGKLTFQFFRFLPHAPFWAPGPKVGEGGGSFPGEDGG